jgi:ATP-dependent exoDNAse (exonuclease V) alpha subunit
VPAYAASIHKSQGSEYPAVVIPVMTQHYAMLQRNLLYTGVTRGKRLVVLVGQKKAVAIAVRNSRACKCRAKGWQVYKVACGHDVMLDEPERLAAILRDRASLHP